MGRPVDPLIPLLIGTPTAEDLAAPGVWERVMEGAAAEGVAQSIAYNVRAVAKGEQREWCDKVLTASWNRFNRALPAFRYVAEVLAEAGVNAVALKGPALALKHYNPPFVRKPSIDLDFAVALPELEKARLALRAAGYSELCSIRNAVAAGYHLVMTHPTRLTVELHFRLTHGTLGIPVEEFVKRAVSGRAQLGTEIAVLAPADELLQLILHTAHDRFAPLFHLYELRRLWTSAAPEVQIQVIQFAEQRHFSAVLYLVDVAFRELWGEPFIPAGINLRRTWLRSRLNPALFRQFRDSARDGFTHTVFSRFRAGWMELQTTDRPVDALRFALGKGRLIYFETMRGGWRPIPKGRQIRIG